MKVRMSELRELCEMILTKAERVGIDEIDLLNDGYWLVLSSQREDLYGSGHPLLAVGSLSDDMESLQKALDESSCPEINDFDRIGNVLIAVGEAISRSQYIY